MKKKDVIFNNTLIFKRKCKYIKTHKYLSKKQKNAELKKFQKIFDDTIQKIENHNFRRRSYLLPDYHGFTEPFYLYYLKNEEVKPPRLNNNSTVCL